jgi:hypothetical protein
VFKHRETSLLGEYDSQDPVVINKHIDWATGHGVDAFAVSWGFDAYPDGYAHTVLKRVFLNSNLIGDIKFAILYETKGRLNVQYRDSAPWLVDLSDQTNILKLIEDFLYFSENFFSSASYLKLGGRPVVFFDVARLFAGDVETAFKTVRETIKDTKGYDPFLISDQIGHWVPPYDSTQLAILKSMDGISTDAFWALSYGSPEALKDFRKYANNAFSLWKKYAQMYNKAFIPVAFPGWDPHPINIHDPHAKTLSRSPGLFKDLLKIALSYSDDYEILIPSFNEFYVSTHVEPDRNSEFLYLDTLKEVI